jgi:hypothetical protein
MPSKKPSKRPPLSGRRPPDRQPDKSKNIYASFIDLLSGAPGALPVAWPPETAATKRSRFKRGEKQEFRSFQKRARKAGLLVNRDSYELYFRNRPVEG